MADSTTTTLFIFAIISGLFLAYILFEPYFRKDPTWQKPPAMGKKATIIDTVHGFNAQVIAVQKQGQNYDLHLDNGYIIPYDKERFHLVNKLHVMSNTAPAIWMYGVNTQGIATVDDWEKQYKQLLARYVHDGLMTTETKNRESSLILEAIKSKAKNKPVSRGGDEE